MPIPKTLSEIEGLLEAAGAYRHPSNERLSKLVKRFVEEDERGAGKSERDVFRLAYGSDEAGDQAYKEARAQGGDDPAVRAFCIAALERMVTSLRREGSRTAPPLPTPENLLPT